MVDMKYADPSLCPGCREELPHGATRCPHCDLLVRHPLAQQVFASLTRADELITQLRQVAPEPAPTPSVRGSAATDVPPPPGPGLRQAQPPASGGGMSFASVPKILLGLGALCLLVAAVIFLAVSWSLLGVGGRTAVLLGLTAASGGAAVLLSRHELRIGAEALATVCLGLVALDVTGAESAGWLGTITDETLAIIAGLVVAAVGTGFAALTRPHLGAPQVAAGLGALVAYFGVLTQTDHELIAGHVVVVLLAGTAWGIRLRGLAVEGWSLLGAGGLVWLITALIGFGLATDVPTVRDLWIDNGAGWSLLASAAALLIPAAILRNEPLLVWSGAGTAVLATVAVTLPAVDESARVFAVVALAATTVWTGVLPTLPRRHRPIAATPAGAGALILGGIVFVTAAVAAARWGEFSDPFSNPVSARFGGESPLTEPLVAAPAVAVIVTLAALVLPHVAGRVAWLQYGGIATGLAALTTLASYDVPLAAVVAGGLLLTGVAAGLAHTASSDRDHTAHGAVALALAGIGCVVALPSSALATVAALAATALAAALHLTGRTDPLRVLGGVALAPAAALTLWAGAEAFAADPAWLGIPVILTVGVLAILRPRVEVEVPAALVAFVAMTASVPAATDVGGSLALHLTVLGGVVSATALINQSRRDLIWPGLALLVLASWVRLTDLGVTAPEPYTLPLALALTGVGLWHLQRDEQAGTMFALVPGLALATVPSLLWVLGDPVSPRALVLGAACVALTIGGGALRWGAPLLVGGVVGAVLVIRELGPYAGSWPQWVWIGLAGILLTVIGITWERRLLEVRKAVGYLGRLR